MFAKTSDRKSIASTYTSSRRWKEHDANQKIIISPGGSFGTTVVNDWTISDGPAPNANIVARARGMHMGDSKDDESVLIFHSILFTDSRFTTSLGVVIISTRLHVYSFHVLRFCDFGYAV